MKLRIVVGEKSG